MIPSLDDFLDFLRFAAALAVGIIVASTLIILVLKYIVWLAEKLLA